jgi:putative transposase
LVRPYFVFVRHILGEPRYGDDSGARDVPELARRLGKSEATFHRWPNQYGGMKGHAMKRLKELESENARLKKIVAGQVVEIDILRR